jgi:hypothetical protein
MSSALIYVYMCAHINAVSGRISGVIWIQGNISSNL